MNDLCNEQYLVAAQECLPLESDPTNFEVLVKLGKKLKEEGYRFTTVTPLTHQRVNARIGSEWASSLADVFGWSRPCKASGIGFRIPSEIQELMAAAAIIHPVPDGWQSALRVSTLDGNLYFHSAYPTDGADSVFFGPDTYRFARLLKIACSELSTPIHRAVDIGCGAGPGAITVATHFPNAKVFAADINDAALHLASVNARLADLHNISTCNSNLLADLPGDFDLIVSNPPYLVDREQRKYRHGGGPLGAGLSVAIVEAALDRLSPGGTLLIYTGTAIRNNVDALLITLKQRLSAKDCVWSYEEIDPDVFGEELEEIAYAQCDRIAAVWLKICVAGRKHLVTL